MTAIELAAIEVEAEAMNVPRRSPVFTVNGDNGLYDPWAENLRTYEFKLSSAFYDCTSATLGKTEDVPPIKPATQPPEKTWGTVYINGKAIGTLDRDLFDELNAALKSVMIGNPTLTGTKNE